MTKLFNNLGLSLEANLLALICSQCIWCRDDSDWECSMSKDSSFKTNVKKPLKSQKYDLWNWQKCSGGLRWAVLLSPHSYIHTVFLTQDFSVQRTYLSKLNHATSVVGLAQFKLVLFVDQQYSSMFPVKETILMKNAGERGWECKTKSRTEVLLCHTLLERAFASGCCFCQTQDWSGKW